MLRKKMPEGSYTLHDDTGVFMPWNFEAAGFWGFLMFLNTSGMKIPEAYASPIKTLFVMGVPYMGVGWLAMIGL